MARVATTNLSVTIKSKRKCRQIARTAIVLPPDTPVHVDNGQQEQDRCYHFDWRHVLFLIYLDKLAMALLEMTVVVVGQLTSYIRVLVNSLGDKNQISQEELMV